MPKSGFRGGISVFGQNFGFGTTGSLYVLIYTRRIDTACADITHQWYLSDGLKQPAEVRHWLINGNNVPRFRLSLLRYSIDTFDSGGMTDE